MIDRVEFEVDGHVVSLYVEKAEADRLLAESDRLLKESAKGKGQQLTGLYFFRKDPPHTPPPVGKYHLHVYKKQTELFAINWDGSGHDNSTGRTIPNAVYDAIKARWPDLNLPASRVIESFDPLTVGKTFKTAHKAGVPLIDLMDIQRLIREANALW